MSLSTEAPLLKTPCLASRKRRPNKVKMLSKSLLAVTLGAVINHSVMAQTRRNKRKLSRRRQSKCNNQRRSK